jgi:hypothetical protein
MILSSQRSDVRNLTNNSPRSSLIDTDWQLTMMQNMTDSLASLSDKLAMSAHTVESIR